MTGGDIYNSVVSNSNMREAYINDEMFRDQIDKLIDNADTGNVEDIADSITLMAYNFLSIYNSFINIICTSKDPKTVEKVDALLKEYYDYLNQ